MFIRFMFLEFLEILFLCLWLSSVFLSPFSHRAYLLLQICLIPLCAFVCVILATHIPEKH